MNNKTYKFYNKNAPITITIGANSFEEAEKELFNLVVSSYSWVYDDFDELDLYEEY